MFLQHESNQIIYKILLVVFLQIHYLILLSLNVETLLFDFHYHITPKITVNASFREEGIMLVFEPVFVLNFEEERIALEGFRNDISERLRFLEKIDVTWNGIPISFLRRAYLVVLFAISLFALISFRRILMQVEIRGIGGIINRNSTQRLVNVVTVPQNTERKIIQMKSLQDLVKVAKVFQQPILHDDNVFVVDHEGNRYQIRKSLDNNT